MTLHVPRLPLSLDPLIAEAKRRARQRRWLILFVLVVATATAVKKQGLYITIRTPNGQHVPLQIAHSLHSGRK
jgi:hypothetical protein